MKFIKIRDKKNQICMFPLSHVVWIRYADSDSTYCKIVFTFQSGSEFFWECDQGCACYFEKWLDGDYQVDTDEDQIISNLFDTTSFKNMMKKD